MGGMKAWWPELLGAPATPAAMRISKDRPDVAVEVLPPGSPFDPRFNPSVSASSSTTAAWSSTFPSSVSRS